MLNKIEKALVIEKIHRFVFNNIYVQNKVNNGYDDLIIKIYDELVSSYPNFRKDLYKFNKKRFNRYR